MKTIFIFSQGIKETQVKYTNRLSKWVLINLVIPFIYYSKEYKIDVV